MRRNISRIFQLLCLTALCSLIPLRSQPRTTNIEELRLGEERAWQNPRFSPDGKSILYTSEDFHGIWQISLETKTSRLITDDPHSGFGFTISKDGKSIAYRSTITLPSGRRKQDVIVQEIVKTDRHVVDSGEDVSNPSFGDNRLLYTKAGKAQEMLLQAASDDIQVLGIENTKILLLRGTKRISLDPLGSGSYIWPSLSPDKKLLVAYEVDRGTFVSDLGGTAITRLGRRDAPSWTHDGKWIAFMNDQDDGHQILSSDILVISPDGKHIHPLTDTPDVIELNQQCSPTEKRVVYNTLDGRIFLLTYAEER